MTHVLRNKNLEINIDLPLVNYCLSRFNWTGKIVAVKFTGIDISGIESLDCDDYDRFGKGFYNEFGIDAPLAYNETKDADWFHKIGVGLLKKEEEQYSFSKAYKIQSSEFKLNA